MPKRSTAIFERYRAEMVSIRENAAMVTIYDKVTKKRHSVRTGAHRDRYTLADYRHVARWLNDRALGYPQAVKNFP